MHVPRAPVLIAYDGSPSARRAIREAAELLGSRRMLVVTVWEPALAYVPLTMPSVGGLDVPEPTMIDPEAGRAIEHNLHQRAEQVSRDGAELARSVGLEAEPLAVPDAGEGRVAEAILAVAAERHVAAIVTGSRGLGGIRARLEGSTSSGLLKHASCPVILVHESDQPHH